jgi:hypothetical protein
MRAQTTKRNIETVVVALASFLANQNRLPRPSHDAGGRESLESGLNLVDFVGKVPYHSLGIPGKSALDGDGKPLVYMVEPQLTNDFSSIYERSGNDYFCNGIFSPSIEVEYIGKLAPDLIAFAIDVHDHPPVVSDKIHVAVSFNTSWFSRDRLLMQYLKNSPCKSEKNTTIGGAAPNTAAPFLF